MSTERRDDLQGLRAVAVLLVAFGHAGIGFLAGGFVGVDVFFVLSGFFITGLLLAEAEKRRSISFVGFYARRAKRILPAAALTLVVTDIAAYHTLNFVRAREVMSDTVWASVFAANVHFANKGTDYFAQTQPPSPLQHYWSLSVEEQFYVVWPALLALGLFGVAVVGRRRRRRLRRAGTGLSTRRLMQLTALAFVLSFGLSLFETRVHRASAYFSTSTRAWELALGALIAIAAVQLSSLPAHVRTRAGYVGFVAIAISAVFFSGATAFPGYAAVLPTLGAALVIIAGLGTVRGAASGVGRFLGTAPMRYVGDRSYTFYLWHWPPLIIAAQFAGHQLSVGWNLLLLAGAFALSIATYAAFENPIRHARLSLDTVGALVVGCVGIALAVAVYTTETINAKVALVAARAAPPPVLAPTETVTTSASSAAAVVADALPVVVRSVTHGRRPIDVSSLVPPAASLLSDHYDMPSGCAAYEGDTSSNICRLGDASSNRVLVVFGDSHAQMWMPAILELAQRDSLAVIPITKVACPPIVWKQSRGSIDCLGWYRWAIRELQSLHPTYLLLAGHYSGEGVDGETIAAQGLVRVADAVAASHKRVVAVLDPPLQKAQPIDCLLRRHATGNTCTTTVSDTDAIADGSAHDVLAESGLVGIIDPTPWVCWQQVCPMVIGHTIAYLDSDHISATYASELAEVFRAAFHQALAHR